MYSTTNTKLENAAYEVGKQKKTVQQSIEAKANRVIQFVSDFARKARFYLMTQTCADKNRKIWAVLSFIWGHFQGSW
jgi:hypothetical protein